MNENHSQEPNKVTLTSETNSQLLSQLQKSFQESAEILGMMQHTEVIEESVEDRQMHFTEDAINNAILESLENGPLFEKVDRSDKIEVKAIVAKLRGKVNQELAADTVFFRVPNLWANIIAGAAFVAIGGGAVGFGIKAAGKGAIGGVVTGAGKIVSAASSGVSSAASAAATSAVKGAASGAIIGATGAATVSTAIKELTKTVNNMIATRMWQILGICHIEDKTIDTITANLQEKFKDELGEYKILAVKVVPTIADQFRMKFGWKNNLKTYMLLVDKKLPSEIKKAQEDLSKEIEKAQEAVKEEIKEDKKED